MRPCSKPSYYAKHLADRVSGQCPAVRAERALTALEQASLHTGAYLLLPLPLSLALTLGLMRPCYKLSSNPRANEALL
jgi:hypothetical protein